MAAGFDQIAKDYDAGFVHTEIGKMQRQTVRNYLEHFFRKKKNLRILELNCGTGEDAIWMAEKGHEVVATDVSEPMINVARLKVKEKAGKAKLSFTMLDIAKPSSYPKDIQFDLIFSNFGGINCIDPQVFSAVVPELRKLLKPDGHFIAVVMPKLCLWEIFYFFMKAKFSVAFRRKRTGSLNVAVGDQMVKTWYYSPTQLSQTCNSGFRTIRKRPVGFFLPPSYLEDYFRRHPGQLQLLNWKEKFIANWGWIAGYSDHFLIDLEVRP